MLDQISISILDPNLFVFEKVTEQDQEVEPKLDMASVAVMDIPKQIDMQDSFNVAAASLSDSMGSTMDTLMIGSFAINFVVSVSMKKILGAIRVLQIIAFFVLIKIEFPPICKLFLEAVYRFTTFRVVPDELMDVVLEEVGI